MRSKRSIEDTISQWSYVCLAALCVFIGFVFDQTKQNNVPSMIVGGFIVLLIVAVVLYWRGQLTHGRLIALLVAAGVLLRIGYALYTPYTLRQHDVGFFYEQSGHAGYIGYIANNLALPNTNAPWQFYHPPLHHILSALWLRINLAVNSSPETAYESVQLLTAFYACAAVLVCHGIIKESRLSQRATTVAMGIVCFHPALILLAGNINNDMLMILCFLTAMLYTIRWYNNPTIKNTVFMALFLGCGMMAKISAVMLAPTVAFVFLIKIWQQRAQTKKLLGQFGLFCLISIPLGTWYPVRNLLLFNQPFTYVPNLGSTFQYVGNYSAADRLWNIPWNQLASPYQNWQAGYNIPLSVMKTATFGESDFHIGLFAKLLLYLNILLAVIALCAMIYMLIKKDKQRTVFNWILAITWLALIASFIKFCFNFPNICTQDFRYIVPTLLIGAVFIGQFLDSLPNASKISKGIAYTMEGVVMLFCIFSAVVYVTLGIG